MEIFRTPRSAGLFLAIAVLLAPAVQGQPFLVEDVWSGSTTRSRRAKANPRQIVTMRTVRVHWTFGV